MPEEQGQKKWYKAVGRLLWGLAKGVSIPIIAGMLAWSVSYPVGMYSCRNYALGLGLDDWRYSWFVCFLEEKGKWYTRDQYETSAVGIRLILSPELKP